MDDIVTEFIRNCCLTERRPNMRMANASVVLSTTNNDVRSTVSGSAAELYIEPVLPCICDIDIMIHTNTVLAVPVGHQIPTRLPDGFPRTVQLWEIHDFMPRRGRQKTYVPGYVYLHMLCTIRRQNDASYAVSEWYWNSRFPWLPRFIFNLESEHRELHGPARTQTEHFTNDNFNFSRDAISTDRVFCLTCLTWPTQAADWPTRCRNNGWPDVPTIERVVATGCAIVGVTHRRCRQEEFLNMFQRRLSFSRAEVVLLNSWTPVQQIVYHMLRFLVKTERLSEQTDVNGETLMSNYHIKTVMLWAAELKPQKWWNDNSNFVRICKQLLKTMVGWMNKADYKQYFIPQCNLVDWERTTDETHLLIATLQSFANGSCLSEWFLNNYVCQCATRLSMPPEIQLLLEDIATIQKLDRTFATTSPLFRNAVHFRRYGNVRHVFFKYMSRVSSGELEPVRRIQQLIADFDEVVPQLRYACNAGMCLQTVHRLRYNKFSKEVLDYAAVAVSSNSATRVSFEWENSSALEMSLYLMRLSNHEESDTLQLLLRELSIAYLLLASHSDNNDTNIYLAAMLYSTGKGRVVLDQCRQLTSPQNPSNHCSLSVIEGEVLPPIDANIDNTLGLVALCQFLQTDTRSQQQQQQRHVNVFSPQLFASYLHMQCLLKLQSSEIELLRTFQYHRELLTFNVEPFITDIMLYQLLCVQLQHRTPVSNICLCQHNNINISTQHPVLHYDTTRLQHLLILAAVDLLTTFDRMQQREYGPHNIAVFPNEYRAMLAYKTGQYEHCFELTNIDIADNLSAFFCDPGSMAPLPQFFPLQDDDLITLRGLLLLLVSEYDENFFSSWTMAVYLVTKCWTKSSAVRRQTVLHTVPRWLLYLHNEYPNVGLNGLVLSFSYRKLVLWLKMHTLEDL